MEKVIITEEQVKKVLDNILSEQMKKVSRQDFSRTQFKIEELQNSLNETIKEFRKLQTTVPSGLQTAANSKIASIGGHLSKAQMEIDKLKIGVNNYKRKMYSRQVTKPEAPEASTTWNGSQV